MSLPGFHTLWMAPAQVRRNSLELSRLEWLVALYGALLWKSKNGPMYLWCDGHGLDYVRKTGLASVYDKINPLRPDLGDFIDPLCFWAGAKVWALSQMPVPCVSLDLDALVFTKLKLWGYLVAGHREPTTWECYAGGEKAYAPYGFGLGWNWEAKPLNCGVVGIRDEFMRDAYCAHSLGFMQAYSSAHRIILPPGYVLEKNSSGSGPGSPGHCPMNAMTFAEQRLLGMVFDYYDHSTNVLGELRPSLPLLEFSTKYKHLWGLKQVYAAIDPDRRESVCQFIITAIKNDFPKWSHLCTNAPEDHGQHEYGEDSLDSLWSRTLRQVKGEIWICDPIFPVMRKAEEGSKLWWGEILTSENDQKEIPSCYVCNNNEALFFYNGARPFPDYRVDIVWKGTPSNLGTI